MRTVQRVARAVRTTLQPDGIVVTQFNGAPAGQTVFHLHVHILPRWEGQSAGAHAAGKMADIAELRATAEKIGAAMEDQGRA
jgi:histidine triad (HIT) family protein